MKTLIVYYSKYNNNTEKIAKMFADKINADLISLKDLSATSVETESYDLVGFGSGVYNEDLSPTIYDFVEKLDLEDKNVFVFSTSCVGFKLYNKKLVKMLSSKGAVCIGNFACKGSFIFKGNKMFEFFSKRSVGHPNEDDMNKAMNFIEMVQ